MIHYVVMHEHGGHGDEEKIHAVCSSRSRADDIVKFLKEPRIPRPDGSKYAIDSDATVVEMKNNEIDLLGYERYLSPIDLIEVSCLSSS